jgi:hypothetical protein
MGATVEVKATQREATAARLRWLLVVGLLAANVVLLAMGLLAAAFGGRLTSWGSGAGGLDGWADLSQTMFSLVVGVLAGIATIREGRSIWLAAGVGITGLLIGTGYLLLSHLVDPCARGWWDSSTSFGDTAACAGAGDIAERFHLLLHAVFGVISAGVAALIYRHRRLFGWWPPEAV